MGATDTGREVEAPEEVQPQKDLRTPDMPTPAEMAEHKDNGHLDPRDWFPDCVEGFGRERAHKLSPGERLIPLILRLPVHVVQRSFRAR